MTSFLLRFCLVHPWWMSKSSLKKKVPVNDLKRWLYGQSTCFASLDELTQILRTHLKARFWHALNILAQHSGNREPSAAGRCLTSPQAWHTLFTYKVCTKYRAVVVLVGKGDKLVTHEKYTPMLHHSVERANCHCTQVTWMGKTVLQFKQWRTFFPHKFLLGTFPVCWLTRLSWSARPTKWRSVPCSWRSCQHTNSKYLWVTVRFCCHALISALCNSASKLCPQKMCTSQHRWMFLLTSNYILQRTKM